MPRRSEGEEPECVAVSFSLKIKHVPGFLCQVVVYVVVGLNTRDQPQGSCEGQHHAL